MEVDLAVPTGPDEADAEVFIRRFFGEAFVTGSGREGRDAEAADFHKIASLHMFFP